MAVRGPPPRLSEEALLADFPFLPGAEALLGGETPSVRALLEQPAYERARETGWARVLAAQDDPTASERLQELESPLPEERYLSYLSFLFARLVLSAAPQAGGIRRWAVAESKRSYQRLQRLSPGMLAEVARRLGFPIEAEADRLYVPVADYVRLASPIREGEFRLGAQELSGGRVAVTPKRAARLLEEAVRRTLAVPLPLTPDLSRAVLGREPARFEELARRVPSPVGRSGGLAGPLRAEAFPPCIRKMRRTLERGENLSHAGRFCLAAFLHRAGASFETIVDAYRGAPDFDESVTRYQVEHITTRDGGRGYEPPTCDTLRSHGLCAREGDPDGPTPQDRGPEPLCFEATLRHPLQYYERRGGRATPREPRA
jgi:DNA primase large subunit